MDFRHIWYNGLYSIINHYNPLYIYTHHKLHRIPSPALGTSCTSSRSSRRPPARRHAWRPNEGHHPAGSTVTRPGKQPHNYKKSLFLMGKLTMNGPFSIAMLNPPTPDDGRGSASEEHLGDGGPAACPWPPAGRFPEIFFWFQKATLGSRLALNASRRPKLPLNPSRRPPA